MNKELIKSVFLMITGLRDTTPFMFYIDTAAEKVKATVKPEFSENIPNCVHAYAAATAAEMMYAAVASHDKRMCTEAGSALMSRDTKDLRTAAATQREYWKAMSAPFLYDGEFVLMNIRREQRP